MKVKRIGQIKDAIIFIGIILLLYKEFRPSKNTIIQEKIYITDTISTEHIKIVKEPVYINNTITRLDTVHHFINDTMIVNVGNDTVYLPPDHSLSLDTIHFDKATVRAVHLTNGVIKSSHYDLDMIVDTIKISNTTINNPIRLSLDFRAAKQSFTPGLHLSTKKVSGYYGYDMIEHKHRVGIGIKIANF